MILFSCVYGLFINLHFPILNWESEVTVVKQSASAVLGGMGDFFLSVLCTLAAFLIPKEYTGLFRVLLCIFVPGITGILYKKITVPDAWKRYGL